jgi:hypothetical protein
MADYGTHSPATWQNNPTHAIAYRAYLHGCQRPNNKPHEANRAKDAKDDGPRVVDDELLTGH